MAYPIRIREYPSRIRIPRVSDTSTARNLKYPCFIVGTWTNSLICVTNDALSSGQGCSALAVNGCRIVTASCGEEQGIIRYRDFTNATCHVSSGQSELPASKFWRGQSYSDSEGSDN